MVCALFFGHVVTKEQGTLLANPLSGRHSCQQLHARYTDTFNLFGSFSITLYLAEILCLVQVISVQYPFQYRKDIRSS